MKSLLCVRRPMPELKIQDVLQLPMAFAEKPLLADSPLGAICTDSRRLRPGQIFWVLRGENFDGHDFVEPALKDGAQAAVVEKQALPRFRGKDLPLIAVPDTLLALQQLAALHRNRFKGTVLALTGSNGKTTTKEMIATVLASKMVVHKTEGNLNNHIGCPLTLLELREKHQAAVIELGSNHPGEIATLAEITRPDQALVTNIGQAHMEFFKTREKVAAEKLSLFEQVVPKGVIFRNQDDSFISGYQRAKTEVVSYSIKKSARVRGRILGLDDRGCATWRLNDSTDIQLQIPGAHNVSNALAAAAVGLYYGLNAQEIKAALEAYRQTDKRMQVVNLGAVKVLNDSYNANPDSMTAAIEALQKMQTTGKCFFVLGDMKELGTQSATLHKQILQKATRSGGVTLVTGPEMIQAATEIEGVRAFHEKYDLAAYLDKHLQDGDLVLLKGSRGMQMEKILDYLQENR